MNFNIGRQNTALLHIRQSFTKLDVSAETASSRGAVTLATYESKFNGGVWPDYSQIH
jgi:hypothetical protein